MFAYMFGAIAGGTQQRAQVPVCVTERLSRVTVDWVPRHWRRSLGVASFPPLPVLPGVPWDESSPCPAAQGDLAGVGGSGQQTP